MSERNIIHINVAHFAAAVEQLVDGGLRDRPVLIAAPGRARSFVQELSERAYLEGARKGMPLAIASRRVRGSRVLPPRPDLYERVMSDIHKTVGRFSPLVERAVGGGHIYLDVSGTGRLFGPPPDIAWTIRRQLRSEIGLNPIWSVASNKLVAKVSSRMVKPTGEYIVEAGDERQFLRPAPVRLLPGFDRRDLLRLEELRLRRVGDLADLNVEQLRVLFGKRTGRVFENVRGIDDEPVTPAGREPDTVFASFKFNGDINDRTLIEAALFDCVGRCGFRLRQRGAAAGRLRVEVYYTDGGSGRGQLTLPVPLESDELLFDSARIVLDRALSRRTRIQSLRLTCERLGPPPAQLDLFGAPSPPIAFGRLENRSAAKSTDSRPGALIASLDEIRNRYGREAIDYGRAFDLAAANSVEYT